MTDNFEAAVSAPGRIAYIKPTDSAEARRLATELDALNAQRREIEADMQLQALSAVRALRDGTGGRGPRCAGTIHTTDRRAQARQRSRKRSG